MKKPMENWQYLTASTVTYAMKAKKLLASRGFTVIAERNVKTAGKTGGCGYVIKIKGDSVTLTGAKRVLKAAGISLKEAEVYREEETEG